MKIDHNTPFSVFPGASNANIVNQSATVSTPTLQYQEMAEDWELVETLRGGTKTIKKAGKRYLPQQPKESDEAYNQRLQLTSLYNVYWRTIQAITGLGFIKPAVVSNVPSELEYLESNFDGTGRSITEVAYDLAVQAVHYGKTHAMMDFPSVPSSEMSLAEFRVSGFRPYCIIVNPRNVIGWRTTSEPGIPVLQQVRITDHKMVPSQYNDWAEKDLFYVRVIYPTYTEIYEYDPEADNASYELVNTVENTLGYIPLGTAYSNQTGFMTAAPAMQDLAQVNLRHYQSSSDQNYILHFSRVPMMFGSGFDEGELEGVEIGPNRMIVSSNAEADLKYIEHTGKAMDSGVQDLKSLENQMALLGADMLISKGVSRMTASARRMDQTESLSILQLTLRSIEQLLERQYMIAGEWLGVDASEVSVSIGEDMSSANEPNPTNALVTFYKETGLLTEDQLVQEAQRQGILSGYFKLDDDRPSADKSFLQDPSQQENVAEEEEEPEENGEEEEENENNIE